MGDDDVDYYRQQEALEAMLHAEREDFKEELAQNALLRTYSDVIQVRRILDEAKTVRHVSPTAAYLLAASACEITIRKLLFTPILSGLVHSEYGVNVVVSAASRLPRNQMDKALASLLRFAFVDLDKITRQTGGPSILREAATVADKRDQIIHHGAQADKVSSRFALQVAHFLLNQVFTRLLTRYGLKLLEPDEQGPHFIPAPAGDVFGHAPKE